MHNPENTSITPDAHWILVKNFWTPIEKSLDELGAVGEDAREKIDSLNSTLPSEVIDKLHRIRIQRNSLIHKDKPLDDPIDWENQAKYCALEINRILIERQQASPPASTSPKAEEGTWKYSLRALAIIFLWGLGSWGMLELCNLLLAKVAKFSFAWWCIGTIWLLCWPGIIVAVIIGAIFYWLGSGIWWVITYIINNPY